MGIPTKYIKACLLLVVNKTAGLDYSEWRQHYNKCNINIFRFINKIINKTAQQYVQYVKPKVTA